MRVVLVVLAITLFLLVSLPAYVVLLIIGRKNPMMKAVISQKIIAGAFRFVLFFAGTKIKVMGLENVPRDRAVLYAANHRGLADIPVGYITLPTPTGYVAKKEINKIPIFNWWMRNMNCLFLDRKDMREGLKIVLKGIENIKNGFSVFIMPEGTRNQREELLPFKEGSLKMAEKTDCPIIPVAVTNTDAVFERQIPFVRRARVLIHYGKPLIPSLLSADERKFLGAYVRDVITDMLREDAMEFNPS